MKKQPKQQSNPRAGYVRWSLAMAMFAAVAGGVWVSAQEALEVKDLDGEDMPELKPEAEEAPLSAAELANQTVPAVVEDEKVKDLYQEGIIVPPKPSEKIQTIRDAVDSVARDMRKSYLLLSTNCTAALEKPFTTDFGGEGMEWGRVLQYILNPEGLNFTEDRGMVMIGQVGEVDAKRKAVAQERLRNNSTTISFKSNATEGGTDLRTAIREIERKAGILINTDYVKPEELGPVNRPKTLSPELSAEELAAKGDVAAPVETFKRTTVSTPENEPMEWRIVLRNVLTPHGYDFIERDGAVVVASVDQIKRWDTEAENAKPMEARVVRIFHANPEVIVDRIKGMKILRHPNASISVTQKDNDDTETFSGGQAGIAISSGTQVGASSIGSGSAFGDLKRPKTPPAVLVYDLQENLDSIVAKIRLMDVREKQVLIEALVLDLNDGFDKELGVNWQGFDNIGLGRVTGMTEQTYDKHRKSSNSYDWNRTDVGKDSTAMTFSSEQGRVSTRSNSRNVEDGFTDIGANFTETLRTSATSISGLLGPVDFTAVLKMVEENNENRVLSSPVLVISDHSEAVIQVGTAEPIPITRVNYIGEDRRDVESETEWQILMTGVTLWVAPEVTEDGNGVRLSVHPQITNPEGYVEAPDGTRYPNVVTRELDTRVVVPSGDTLLLGGLIRSVESEMKTKIPILGDIPFLGRLFRSTKKSTTQRNLVILIRPTVLDDEKPVTEFEDPAMKIIDPMMSRSGRNLKLPEPNRVMEDREEKVKEGVKSLFEAKKSEDEEAAAEEVAVDASIVKPGETKVAE